MEELAWKVIDTFYDYDPYSFDDSFDDKESALEQVMDDLRNGGQLTIAALCDICNDLMEG